MINKFSTSEKLYLLMFITATSLIGLGFYAVNDLKRMNDNTRTLYSDRVLCIQQLSNIRGVYGGDILPIPESVQRHKLGFSEAKKRVQQAQEIIDTNWRSYKRTYLTPEEKLLVKQTDVLKTQADEANKNLISILFKEDTPALNKLVQREDPAAPAPFAVKVTQLMDLQVQVAKEILNNNKTLYRITSTNFIVFIVLSLAIALSLSFYIVKNVRGLIKDLLRRNNEIKKSEEKYRRLIETACDAIYLLDFKGNFTDANEIMCQMTGYSKEELLRSNIEDIVDPDQLKTDPLIHGYRHLGKSLIRERRFVRKDGTQFDVEINVNMFADNQVLVIARDITERKHAQELILREKALSETIINSLPGIFYLRNEQGKLVRWNKNVELATGYTAQEIERLTVREMIDSEDHQIVNMASEKVFKEGYATAEARLVAKDGGRIPFLLTGSPIIYENQLCLLGTGIDISSRIQAEESLKKSEANLKTIMDTTDTAYALLDKELNVIAFNKMVLKFVNSQFQYSPVKGDKLADYFPKERFPQFLSYADRVLKGENISYEINYPQPDGSEFWYYVRLFPITNDENEIFGLMLALSDVTDHKISEKHLEELNTNLQKHAKKLAISNAELEQFAYVASHDLQEPLRMVTSFMTLLEKKYGDAVDDKGRQYINFAVDGAKRMRRIILDLLDFSRVGSTDDDPEEVNFTKLINEILGLHRRLIEEVNARVTFENLPTIQTYKTPIRQVFQNLIGNSLKYHKPGVAPAISINCKETKAHFQFSVNDNGIGIAPKYFDRIFIIFQRLHNKDEYSGTGMGLAITKKIVETLGGKIWVESEEGKGSTFYFTLPKKTRA